LPKRCVRGILQTSPKQKRCLSYDLLRIAAAFAVVFAHTSFFVTSHIELGSVRWQAVNGAKTLTVWAVGVFIFLSGTAFLNPNKKIDFAYVSKKAARLLTALVFWNCFYEFCILIFNGKLTGTAALLVLWNTLTGRAYYHLWFLYALTALYFLTPLFRRILCKLNKRQTGLFILLTLLAFNIIPFFIFGISVPSQWLFSLFYIPLYLSGYYLSAFPPGARARKILYAAALCIVIAIPVGNYFLRHIDPKEFILAVPNSPLVFVMSVALTVFFKERFPNERISPKLERSIALMRDYTFGVYLIHDFFITLFMRVIPQSLLLRYAALIELPLAVLIFGVSLAVVFCIRKIPFGKYIT